MPRKTASRANELWTKRETDVLVRNRARGRSYSDIASMKTFSGRRTIKALRRRYERVELGL